jgi:NitT/TauT family transport system ATP-binding protein
MIRLSGICFGHAAAIFERFSLHVARGETLSVLGPSGCGKTTLLYLLAGLLQPHSGLLTIDGAPLRRPRPRTGLVLQDLGLLPWASVRQNTRLGLEIRRFYGPDARHAPAETPLAAQRVEARVEAWMRRLGLEALAARFPAQLSRGQRQRTALARTLVLEPDLLLLDEPFSALDAPAREELRDTLNALQAERGMTRVIVTHDIQEAALMGRRILVLRRGINRAPRLLEPPWGTEGPRGTGSLLADACTELRRMLEEGT